MSLEATYIKGRESLFIDGHECDALMNDGWTEIDLAKPNTNMLIDTMKFIDDNEEKFGNFKIFLNIKPGVMCILFENREDALSFKLSAPLQIFVKI